jgi:DnaJ-class molecular chaperone
MSKTTVKETPVRCVVCSGSGKNPENKEAPCVGCSGDGWLYTIETVTESQDPVDFSGTQGRPTVAPSYQPELITCTNCWGSGKIYVGGWYGYPFANQGSYSNCPICGGTGKVTNYTYTIYSNTNTSNKIEIR